jgi:hypothetical protein
LWDSFKQNTGVTKMGSVFKMIRREEFAYFLAIRGNLTVLLFVESSAPLSLFTICGFQNLFVLATFSPSALFKKLELFVIRKTRTYPVELTGRQSHN